MPAPFAFQHRLDFSPDTSDDLLRRIPAAPGVFALYDESEASEPYLTRAADLRRRIRRILAPPDALNPDGSPVLSKRLNLRDRVRHIHYSRTGSDFESTLVLYHATLAAFGPEQARKRLRLHTPYFLRVTTQNAHPRVYATNRLSARSLSESFGPFPSRAAAERYCDAVLDLFLLRRCHEDLEPSPAHPGCVYGEMNKCLRPCQQACTPAQYAAESARVFDFFRTRGQSLLTEVAAQRDAASADLDFELAATLHKHWEKVRAASLLADELVRPLQDLRAVILQPSAPPSEYPEPQASEYPEPQASGYPEPSGSGLIGSEKRGALAPGVASQDASVFLLSNGHLLGPQPLSTLGIRAVREQTEVGSSLFAQPLMLAPIPLEPPTAPNPSEATSGAAQAPDLRLQNVLKTLENASNTPAPLAELCDAISLFRRWYYRPEKQRTGEVFLPQQDGSWPNRRILNAAARIVLGPPTPAPPVDRAAAKDTAKALKTKLLHPGREGVEREVPVLPKRSRSRKAITPSDVSS